MYILSSLWLDMITPKLILFRQAQARWTEGYHNVSLASKKYLCCLIVQVLWQRGLTKWCSIKNRTDSLTESARSCSLQFLEPERTRHHWTQQFRSLKKTSSSSFYVTSLLFVCEVLPGHDVHCSRHSEIPGSCAFPGLSLACRYKDSCIQNIRPGAFSTTQIPRHVRVSWHATSCTASHTQLWSVTPRKLAGLSAPGWKERTGCWSLRTLCNHLLSQLANLFCQWWDWITFQETSEVMKHGTQQDSEWLQTGFFHNLVPIFKKW